MLHACIKVLFSFSIPRYYWCMFLARLRSCYLVNLDELTANTIDELITTFLDKCQPSEITKWEKDMSYVWMTMVPLVHLALAGGRCYQGGSCSSCGKSGKTPSCHEHSRDLGSKRTNDDSQDDASCRSDDIHADEETVALCMENFKIATKKIKTELFVTTGDELHKPLPVPCTSLAQGIHSVSDNLSELEQDTSVLDERKPATWLGSRATQRLGLFILQHMLSIEEDRTLFLSENLLPYAIYLSWVLEGGEKENMRTSLARFEKISVSSLKDLAKCVLAQMHGLDLVIKM